MEIIESPEEMQAFSEACRRKGETIGFVPTMGFLHEGHLSLLRIAGSRADRVVLSIFVNPTQFGANEDLDKYPKSLEKDLEAARSLGVDAVFTPTSSALYPPGYETYVALESLPMHLCGLSRPVHFRGVATVVTKLFHMVKPHVAVFGEKDFQQLAVIRKMVRDLHFDIEIIGGPIVRENDGLAMSSRNTYLSEVDRKAALSLSRSMQRARDMVKAGETDAAAIIRKSTDFIARHPNTRIDYIALVNPDTLEDLDTVQSPALMALAVFVGNTRLIDNTLLIPPEKP